MKKVLALLLAAMMVFALAACAGNTAGTATKDEQSTTAAGEKLKAGFIYLHDENSTYDLNFINAAKAVCERLGVEYVGKVGIPEGNECYEAAAELAEAGCDLVFADSFGHEDYMIQAAKEFTDVQFCHATGTKAHTEKLANYHNAFASIYEGRYLAGIVAGMKLNEMIDAKTITAEQAKIGYVGAMPYAEVKSGMTSFFLGARSVCPTATIEVKYTNSWYDETLEKEYANALIGDGCVLISQHADSMGAPNACEAANVPNVSYNGSTLESCPKTFLVSSRINWEPYFEYVLGCIKDNKAIDTDWSGTIENGAVELSEYGTSIAEGTEKAVDDAKAKLADGSLKVFATNTFTVGGNEVTTYLADVDSDAAFTGETEVIKDGAFLESEFRSAPYFDLDIDGVTTK